MVFPTPPLQEKKPMILARRGFMLTLLPALIPHLRGGIKPPSPSEGWRDGTYLQDFYKMENPEEAGVMREYLPQRK